jgi:hypothetical protein
VLKHEKVQVIRNETKKKEMQSQGFIIEVDPDTNVQVASRVDLFESVPRQSQILSDVHSNDMSVDDETETIPIEDEEIEFEETEISENVRNILDIINPNEHPDIYAVNNLQDILSNEFNNLRERLQITSQDYFVLSAPPPLAPLGKSDNVLDSFTGAPLPASAKTISFTNESEFYEVETLTNFFLSMRETRNPSTGRKLTEKEIEKIADCHNPSTKERLMQLFKCTELDYKPLSFVKSKYFEDSIYGMILQCLILCELDEVVDVHVSIQEFNKRYFPTIIRSMSGLSLTNPTKLLKVCKNVTDQINSVLTSINTKDDDEFAEEYIYHPVVLRSVSHALLSLCTLSTTQYYSALSSSKYSSKICEVPIARIIQKNIRHVAQT